MSQQAYAAARWRGHFRQGQLIAPRNSAGPELARFQYGGGPGAERSSCGFGIPPQWRYTMTDYNQQTQHGLMTCSFRDRASAEREYNALLSRGYRSDEIHVLMSDETRKLHFGKGSETTEMGNKALKGAGVGGAVGGAVGATLMGLAAAAATITVPGLGLVIVGPLAGALAGGAAGATAGGLAGILVGAGIPESRAKMYETELKNGAIILGVKPKNDADARYFESEWEDY